MTSHVQGTTSTRAIMFRADCTIAAIAQQEFPQHFPQSGWVEHDPEDLRRTTLATCHEAVAKAGLAARDIAAIGITNQRETTLVWDRASGKPIHNAIVWQDRRTTEMCRKLKDAGNEARVAACTGLVLDPYFSASKIAWLLDQVPGARAKAERGDLASFHAAILRVRVSASMAAAKRRSSAQRAAKACGSG
jgi:glycerol kinase